MPKQIKLQHSESVVAHVASRIYCANIVAGKVVEGSENACMKKSISEAIRLCIATDEMVISDDEVSGLGQSTL